MQTKSSGNKDKDPFYGSPSLDRKRLLQQLKSTIKTLFLELRRICEARDLAGILLKIIHTICCLQIYKSKEKKQKKFKSLIYLFYNLNLLLSSSAIFTNEHVNSVPNKMQLKSAQGNNLQGEFSNVLFSHFSYNYEIVFKVFASNLIS